MIRVTSELAWHLDCDVGYDWLFERVPMVRVPDGTADRSPGQKNKSPGSSLCWAVQPSLGWSTIARALQGCPELAPLVWCSGRPT